MKEVSLLCGEEGAGQCEVTEELWNTLKRADSTQRIFPTCFSSLPSYPFVFRSNNYVVEEVMHLFYTKKYKMIYITLHAIESMSFSILTPVYNTSFVVFPKHLCTQFKKSNCSYEVHCEILSPAPSPSWRQPASPPTGITLVFSSRSVNDMYITNL